MVAFDAIVLGIGAVGSAALDHLARRGARVLGIDRFPPAHDRGSSHGQTRIIRQAYFEHPNYVPLVLRAYEHWRDLESRREQQLFHQVGLLQVGPPDGEVVTGVLDSARLHRLDVEELTAGEVAARWPGFAVPATMRGVFEAQAGYLEVENCIRAYIEEAQRSGAQIVTDGAVCEWTVRNGQVLVETDRERYTARRLLIAAGAWASQMLPELGVPLQVVRKAMCWYAPRTAAYDVDGCPCFLFETAAGEFYGFPSLTPWGVKVAEHTGGQIVADPLLVPREVTSNDEQPVLDFVSQYLPKLGGQRTHQAVCLYTLTPDRHFLIDRHFRHDQVFYVAGLSGHGFKFAPVLGQALADLALENRTDLPIEFLNAARFR